MISRSTKTTPSDSARSPNPTKRHAITLTPEQIATAGRLHQRLRQWQFADRCLMAIAERFPGFDHDACFIKTTILDRLYSTNIPDLVRAAEHIHRTMVDYAHRPPDIELVEHLGVIPAVADDPLRRQGSFASKFAHFFLNNCQFPIMDKYSQRMVAYHLGKSETPAQNNRSYKAFYAEWNELRQRDHLTCSCRELDCYLWISGQYRAWNKSGKRSKTNLELRRLFREPGIAGEFQILLPSAQ